MEAAPSAAGSGARHACQTQVWRCPTPGHRPPHQTQPACQAPVGCLCHCHACRCHPCCPLQSHRRRCRRHRRRLPTQAPQTAPGWARPRGGTRRHPCFHTRRRRRPMMVRSAAALRRSLSERRCRCFCAARARRASFSPCCVAPQSSSPGSRSGCRPRLRRGRAPHPQRAPSTQSRAAASMPMSPALSQRRWSLQILRYHPTIALLCCCFANGDPCLDLRLRSPYSLARETFLESRLPVPAQTTADPFRAEMIKQKQMCR
mmetsp:Transcript_5747/g.17563  ORF Transcript_5747/g.17563 Transcript_5747/m.17563 type:complete len:260 (-) Transcript_5747:161-940(-)